MLEKVPEGDYVLPELTFDITLLPISREREVGIYPNATSQLVKEFRSAGLSAQFLDPPERRNWQKLLGDVPLDLLVAIAAGVASNAVWAGMVKVLASMYGADRKAHVRLVRQRKKPDGTVSNDWFSYDGDIKGLGDCWEKTSKDDG